MDSEGRHRCVALVGPTASGKSTLSLEVAHALGVPVLCCDSVQVYRGLDIGSAKPTPAARARVTHHLLDLVEPDRPFTALDYSRAAEPLLRAGPGLFVGGTGLYLRSVALTTTSVPGDRPPGDPVRDAFEDRWRLREAGDPGAIHRELTARDPKTAGEIHPRNAVRALRALWLCACAGEPVSAVRARNPPRARLDLRIVVLDPGVTAVDERIERRCDVMLDSGLVPEVSKLRSRGYDSRCKAMQSLGYRQISEHLEGTCTLAQARTSIIDETRAYARRQRTFFRHKLPVPSGRVAWIERPDDFPLGPMRDFLAGDTP